MLPGDAYILIASVYFLFSVVYIERIAGSRSRNWNKKIEISVRDERGKVDDDDGCLRETKGGIA